MPEWRNPSVWVPGSHREFTGDKDSCPSGCLIPILLQISSGNTPPADVVQTLTQVFLGISELQLAASTISVDGSTTFILGDATYFDEPSGCSYGAGGGRRRTNVINTGYVVTVGAYLLIGPELVAPIALDVALNIIWNGPEVLNYVNTLQAALTSAEEDVANPIYDIPRILRLS